MKCDVLCIVWGLVLLTLSCYPVQHCLFEAVCKIETLAKSVKSTGNKQGEALITEESRDRGCCGIPRLHRLLPAQL